MVAMGIAMVVAQTPAGALIDATTQKRLVMAPPRSSSRSPAFS
jgi:hypothetical protein